MEQLYHKLCLAQMRIDRMRRRIIESRVRGLGIHPSQHVVLMHLIMMGPSSSQAQIAEHLDVSPASVARTLKSLEASGYIARSGSDVDGRRNEIAITRKGEEVARRSREIFGQLEAASFVDFGEGELEEFDRLLQKILGNLCRLERGDADVKNGEEEMKPL